LKRPQELKTIFLNPKIRKGANGSKQYSRNLPDECPQKKGVILKRHNK